MKKALLAVALAFVTFSGMAQKLDKAKDYLTKGKIAEAKTEIENFLAVEKNKGNAEAIYVKGKVYQAIAKDANLKATVTDPRTTAFECFKQYRSMESTKDSTKRYTAMILDNNAPLFDLYREYSADGATYFNANNFNDAMVNFGKCLEVFDYLGAEKLIPAMFDTTTTLYAGISAEKASKKDDAAKYYSRIADKKIVSEGFIEIYKWVADYYRQKSDIDKATHYSQLGREAYPKDQFWDAFDLEMIQEKGTKEQLFAKYEQVIKNNPENHLFPFNYAVELYQVAYTAEASKRPANSKELIAKSQEFLKKSIAIKGDYANAQMLLGQIIYNEGVDINNDMKAIRPPAGGKLKPEELKKKNDLRAETTKKFDEAVPYFEKVEALLNTQGKLKMDDKMLLKDALDILVTIYENKGNAEKAKEYTDKFNDVDKKHSGN